MRLQRVDLPLIKGIAYLSESVFIIQTEGTFQHEFLQLQRLETTPFLRFSSFFHSIHLF